MSALAVDPSVSRDTLVTELHCLLGPAVEMLESQIEDLEKAVGTGAWLPLYALRNCLLLSEELWSRCGPPGATA